MTIHIFDIDTTIADNTHRARFLEKTCVVCLGSKPHEFHAPCPTCRQVTRSHVPQGCWDKFFDHDLVAQDRPEPKAQRFVEKLRIHPSDAEIHFLTGREEMHRDVTEFWLREHFHMQGNEQLIMRPADEAAFTASVYKERAVNRFLLEDPKGRADKMLFFYEDDPYCLDMYGRYGIVVKCPEAWDYLMPDAPMDRELPFSII